MPKPKMNGSGDAYQTWNSDHAAATSASIVPTVAGGLAPAEVGFLDELVEPAALAGRVAGLRPVLHRAARGRRDAPLT